MIILTHASKPLMYIWFENFKLRFNVAISLRLFPNVTKSSASPGNSSLALSCQSLPQVLIDDQIHFAEERLYDAPLKKDIANDLLYCNQKLFHYLFSDLKVLGSWALGNKLRGDRDLIFSA